MDLALALTGACLAALWASAPTLALLAVGPMVLVYRALWVPVLEHKSRTDSKTGLHSSEYLTGELENALACAKRDESGLSLVMIDLDQLRGINNRRGHLAGDKVIRAVAEVVSEAAAAHDGIASRFGGDELCLLLPGKSLDPATEIAEEVRTRIGDIRLTFKGSHGPLAVTASVGIASYPEHAATVESLLAAADVAVYDAKLGGRNRTRMPLPSDLREALKLEAEERASHQHAPAVLGDAEEAVNGHAAEEAPAPAPGRGGCIVWGGPREGRRALGWSAGPPIKAGSTGLPRGGGSGFSGFRPSKDPLRGSRGAGVRRGWPWPSADGPWPCGASGSLGWSTLTARARR